MSRFRFSKGRLIKALIILGLVLIAATGGMGIWAYRQLTLSLPMLDGRLIIPGIQADVSIDRDALVYRRLLQSIAPIWLLRPGLCMLKTGFFHMDLLRRNAAGELSELIGSALIDRDKSTRMHRFRAAAKRNLESESESTRQLLQAYADGVNAGLRSLRAVPFEYLLLGQSPSPWTPEDSLLVVFSMFLDLQGNQFESERQRGLLQELVPQQAFDFLVPRGGQLDAPIFGEAFPSPVIPGPEVFDPRSVPKPKEEKKIAALNRNSFPHDDVDLFDTPYAMGSNNWAVSGSHTKDGRALVANDMHLRIQVPHIWYRASFVLQDATQDATRGEKNNSVTGVTLPGAPAVIVGSNGHVAWGFTNSEADWVDVVVVEADPEDEKKYRTQSGSKSFEMIPEVIKVRGAKDVTIEVKTTDWGLCWEKINRVEISFVVGSHTIKKGSISI